MGSTSFKILATVYTGIILLSTKFYPKFTQKNLDS
jgi:hypothetical protein